MRSEDESFLPILDKLHKYVYKQQNIMSKEAQQFATPKMQEGLVRLDGINHEASEKDFSQWIESLSKRGVSEIQKVSLKDLLSYHYQHLTEIHDERKDVISNIRSCYQAKNIQSNINYGGTETPIFIAIANQIELLKKSIQIESELFSNTLDTISEILTPYQEAELMVKHYEFYKDKLSTYQLLNNIWKSLNSD